MLKFFPELDFIEDAKERKKILQHCRGIFFRDRRYALKYAVLLVLMLLVAALTAKAMLIFGAPQRLQAESSEFWSVASSRMASNGSGERLCSGVCEKN